MRVGLFLIVGLFLGAFAAHFLVEDRGYVLMHLRGYSVEMSVPVLIMALLALYVLVRLVIRLLEAPRRIGGAIGARGRAAAQGALTRGLAEISAGNLTRGERILTRQAVRGDAPVLAYLGAARAAQLQGATARRDDWLRRAREHAPGDVPAVLVTQAELQIADGQHDEALATLRRLEAIRPKHARGLALQAGIYEQREDWAALDALMPQLRREKALPEAALQRLEQRLAGQALRLCAERGDGAGLRQRWKQLGSRRQRTAELNRQYVEALIDAGEEAEAADAIRRSLRERWDPELLYAVGRLGRTQRKRLQPQVTAWRRRRAQDPALLYAAAVLTAEGDPDKAIARVEESLESAPRLEAWQLYGQLLATQGRHDEASAAFREALACTAEGRERRVPLLDGPAAAAGTVPARTGGGKPPPAHAGKTAGNPAAATDGDAASPQAPADGAAAAGAGRKPRGKPPKSGAGKRRRVS